MPLELLFPSVSVGVPHVPATSPVPLRPLSDSENPFRSSLPKLNTSPPLGRSGIWLAAPSFKVTPIWIVVFPPQLLGVAVVLASTMTGLPFPNKSRLKLPVIGPVKVALGTLVPCRSEERRVG